MVFQSPSLMPWLTARENVALGVSRVYPRASRAERADVADYYLERVGLGDALDKPAAEMSNGMRQRVGIARAFAGDARIVVADEPVSALDVSVQAAVTDLLMEIQRREKTTLLFISHDLSIVRYLSDRVLVMYLGHIVEQGTTEQVFQPPYHPYTEALLSAAPVADTSVTKNRIVLEGEIPSAMNPPPGCPFQTRCPRKAQVASDLCETALPPMREIADGHRLRCHLSGAILDTMAPVIAAATAQAGDPAR